MHDLNVLITFVLGLAAALALGYAAQRLRLSPIVGYLLAGVLVGPFTPGLVADSAVAEQFAEMGVILLLFGIGLKFHIEELVAVWRVALPGALLQSAASTLVMAALAHALGWSWTSGLVLGSAISVASTVIMALVLGERGDLHAPIGHIAIGWTVVEDLITVILLLLLPLLLSSEGAASSGLGPVLAVAGLKVVALALVVMVLGKWVIPWALERIAATRSRELFTLSVLVLALGVAVGSAKLFGVSMALGAFLAGLAVGRSEFAARAASDALPMRDAFAVLFFVSVGMLCDPRAIVASPWLTVVVLGVVVLVKPLAATIVVRLLGRPLAIAIPVGAALSQVGEFSFILGALARKLGVLDAAAWNALVAAAFISTAIHPTLYGWVRKRAHGLGARAAAEPPAEEEADPNRCVIIGYGPVGRTVRRILEDCGAEVAVVELNLDTVRALRREGTVAVYGDALRPGVLEEAGVARARSLVVSAEIEDAAELVRHARSLNPSLEVLVRCAHLREAPALRSTGAKVFAGEAEVAVALAEAAMVGNAAGLDALEMQRLGLRRKLYGPSEATGT